MGVRMGQRVKDGVCGEGGEEERKSRRAWQKVGVIKKVVRDLFRWHRVLLEPRRGHLHCTLHPTRRVWHSLRRVWS